MIAFVDDHNVRNLEQSCLHGLHFVTQPGGHHRDNSLGNINNGQILLPDANGFDEDHFVAGSLQDLHHFWSGLCDSTVLTARGDTADKHALIG